MDEGIDIVFDPESRSLLNFLLAFIMFGVALDLRFADIVRAFRRPQMTVLGLFSQFILLPAVTFLLALLWQPMPGLALGMFLVAACPGGAISNFMSSLAKADLGLSVTLTAISTLCCLFLTPFNFSFWSGLYPGTEVLLRSVDLDPLDLIKTVFLFLIIPVLAGMIFGARKPLITEKIKRPVRGVSMLIFMGFVTMAFLQNKEVFITHARLVVGLVVLHNLLAILVGYLTGRLGRVGERGARSLAIETGIQNAGLGLVICFNFFPDMGHMALLCASWGIWHIVSGLILSFTWSRFPPTH